MEPLPLLRKTPFQLLVDNLLQPQLPLKSCHTILSFIVPVLVGLLSVKHPGNSTSPFQTHPATLHFAVACLLVYGLFYGAALHFPAYVGVFSRCMVLFGSLMLASLASLLFPDSWQWMFFVLYTTFSMGGLLFALLQMLWKWIHPVDEAKIGGVPPMSEPVQPQIIGDEETSTFGDTI